MVDKQKIKILAVDDNQDNLITIKALIYEGFPSAEVSIATDGYIAFEKAVEIIPDVILLDIIMPGIDGFETCKRIKQHKELSDTPIIFVTALKGDSENRVKALNCGAEAFLSKPIDSSELYAQIRAMMKIKKANTQTKNEKERLKSQVEERTKELRKTHIATLNLLEDLKREIDARKQTEEALKTSEALYRSVLNASPDTITVSDLNGKIRMVSRKGVELLGFSAEKKIINSNIFDFLRPEDVSRAKKILERFFSGEQTTSSNFLIRKADNTYIHTEINAEFIEESNGSSAGFVFVIRDISDRIHAQERIRESERKYRLITEKISDVVWIMDLHGKSIFVSQSIEKFTGYTVEEYLRQTIKDRFTPESGQIAHKSLQTEVEYYIENPDKIYSFRKILCLDYLCKDGSIKTGELLVTPYIDNGELIGLHGVTRDITERKQSELALEASERKYRELLDNSPEGITIYVNGMIAYINNEATRMMGTNDKSLLLGKTIVDFIAPENIELVLERMKFVANAPLNMPLPAVEEKYVRLDGTEFYVEIKPMVIIFDGKKAVQLAGRDITERKIAESIIKRSEVEFRTVWENSANGLRLANAKGRIIRVNNSFAKIVNMSVDDLEGQSVNDIYSRSFRKNLLDVYTQRFAEGKIIPSIEKEVQLWNNKKIWLQIENSFLNIENEEPLLLSIFTDITERKVNESRVRHLTRLYALLSQINQAFVRYQNLDELFQRICDIAIEYGKFRMAWIGRYDYIENKIRPFSYAGHEAGYLNIISDVLDNIDLYDGPTGLAIKKGKLVFSSDIANDVNLERWKDEALNRGYLSAVSVPLIRNGKIYGTLNLYASEQDFFDEDEQKLLVEIGEDVSFAITALDAEEERKKTEEALIESENRYNTFINNNVDMIFVKDENLRYLIANDALAKFFKQPIENIIFKTDDELGSNNIIKPCKSTDIKALSSDRPVSSIEVLDGRYYESTKFRMPLKNGKFGVGGILHDITERRESEIALEESRLELKTIYDNAPVMMCVLSENEKVLFTNDAFREYVNLPGDLIEGKRFGDIVVCIESLKKGCGNGAYCKKCVLNTAIKSTFREQSGKQNIEYHARIIDNGIEKEVYLLGSTALIDYNADKKLLLCLYDITGRKTIEKALEKSEMFLRTFIDNAPFQIWSRDRNNVGILENKMLKDRFGSILNKDIYQLTHITEEQKKIWIDMNERVFNGEIIDEELEFYTKEKKINFHQLIFPIKVNNNIEAIAGFNIDITERIKQQQILKESQEQLKQFAAHLQNIREEERVVLAREIHDDLGQILVAVKMDLGMLGLKSQKFIKEEAAGEFMEQFKRVSGMVDNTIKTARRIMTNLRPEVLDLLGLIETLRSHVSSFAERYQIDAKFETNIDKFNMENQNSVAIFRIVQESLNNVAKHAKASKVLVSLNKHKSCILLKIKDNGVGFDTTNKRKFDSFGLMGMNERAYLLDADFVIESKPGVGTEVRLSIPISKIDNQSDTHNK
ncbi:MAG: PAS domain S-box protein [Paludibacter sp.]|nr:PAS domain S-box protein [Paludibacter sp.]